VNEAEQASRAPAARLFDVRLLGRHQLAAIVATLVDFVTMIAIVELLFAPPPVATFFSATVGGVTNFSLGRSWAFRSRHQGSIASQATRYAIVCIGGALLNAGMLSMLLRLGDPPYIVTRVLVSALVSVAYTYPMHTRFVFRVVGDAGDAGDAQ
jgi:putative flippase GtrA